MTITSNNEVWLWEAVDSAAPFVHPGEIPRDRDLAKKRLMDSLAGPFLAKISKVTFVNVNKEGMVTIQRDGALLAVPKSRILHWCEGLLVLYALKIAGLQVKWFNKELERLMKSYVLSGVPAQYVKDKLLHQAVTGAKYRENRMTHRFRRALKSPKEEEHALEEVSGFWKIEKLAGYLPPWEAYHTFGFYQDFYLVQWQRPFSDVDYSRTENGASCLLGCTWEPDECLPPQLDAQRTQQKEAWVRRQEADGQVLSSRKRRINWHAQTPTAKFRRDGQPLELDLFRFKLGHDYQPDVGHLDVNDMVVDGWPSEAAAYPEGYGAVDPPGYCGSCKCMGDGVNKVKEWLSEEEWLEEQARTAAAEAWLLALERQSFLRRRGQVSGQGFLESTLEMPRERTGLYSRLESLGKEVQSQICQAMQRLPLQALFDRSDEVRIPAVAFQEPGKDFSPLSFHLSADTLHHCNWLSIRPSDGLLTGQCEGSKDVTVKVDLHGLQGNTRTVESIDFTVVPNLPDLDPRTVEVVNRVKEMFAPNQNLGVILREHLSPIYDFSGGRPTKNVRFGQWLHCMGQLLMMLRSLPTAKLLLDAVV